MWLYIKKKTVGLLARVEMFLINFEVNSNIFIFNYCCCNRVQQLVILLFPFLHERSLSEEYYQHYALLVGGIFLLSGRSISPEQLETAGKFLIHFVEMFDAYYGLSNFMTWN